MFAQSGLSIEDIDVMALYDPNSFEIIRTLECLGVCKEGRAARMSKALGLVLNHRYR